MIIMDRFFRPDPEKQTDPGIQSKGLLHKYVSCNSPLFFECYAIQ